MATRNPSNEARPGRPRRASQVERSTPSSRGRARPLPRCRAAAPLLLTAPPPLVICSAFKRPPARSSLCAAAPNPIVLGLAGLAISLTCIQRAIVPCVTPGRACQITIIPMMWTADLVRKCQMRERGCCLFRWCERPVLTSPPLSRENRPITAARNCRIMEMCMTGWDRGQQAS